MFSCSLFNETTPDYGSLSITTDRSLAGDLEINLTHSDGTNKVIQSKTGEALNLRLKNGEWDILLKLKDSTGKVTHRGSNIVEITKNTTANVHVPMFAVGTSTLQVSFSYSSSLINNIQVIAINKFDTSKTYNLYSGLPMVSPYTTSPADIESGVYDVIATAYKGTEVIGGLVETVTIGDGENASISLNSIPASTEYAVRNNSVIRLDIDNTIGSTDDIVTNRVLTYVLNNGKYDLTYSDELKDNPRVGAECTYFVYPILSGAGVPVGKGMKILISQGRYTGKIDLNFSADYKGSFTFNLSTGGELRGNFYYYSSPLGSMDYYLQENPNVLIDFGIPQASEYKGLFNINFNDSTFIPQPIVDLSATPSISDTPIPYNNAHSPRSIEVIDETGTGKRKVRVNFSYLGFTNTLTFHFLSRYRGIAEYTLYDTSASSSFYGVAPFTFANNKSEYFISNTGNKPYRRIWDYVKTFHINGLYILASPSNVETFSLKNSYSTNYDLRFFNELNSYKNSAIHIAGGSVSISDVTNARVFDDCDILGTLGEEVVIKGKVANANKFNLIFHNNALAGKASDGEDVFIKFKHSTPKEFNVYKKSTSYSTLFTPSNLIGTLTQ